MPVPKRDLYNVPLQPLAGARFQPTGFPDIGSALYDRPIGADQWESCLLLESVQSMANHLEAQGWDSGTQQPVGALSGLPYVRVLSPDGSYLTSSRTEAHRLAAGFVKDSTLDGIGMREVIRDRLGLRDDTPLAPRDIAAAVFALDPLALLHGVLRRIRKGLARPAQDRAGPYLVCRGLRRTTGGLGRRQARRRPPRGRRDGRGG